MTNTKENILLTALHLFSHDGYEAVSVSDIAGELGISKSALYNHYKNKRDIFDNILDRMKTSDASAAKKYELPEDSAKEMGEAYKRASVDKIISFAGEMFRFWTEDDFGSSFRRMLTLEQYRNEEMGSLYQQYLVAGPTVYLTELFSALNIENPHAMAIKLYAPMFFYYNMYDGAKDKSAIMLLLNEHINRFAIDIDKKNETENYNGQ